MHLLSDLMKGKYLALKLSMNSFFLFINACLPNVILQHISVPQYPGWCVCNIQTEVVRLLVPYFNTCGPTGSIATVCNEKRYWDLQLIPADSAEPYKMGAIHKQDLTLIETQTPTYTHIHTQNTDCITWTTEFYRMVFYRMVFALSCTDSLQS